jgi:hypothetical protein
MWASLFKTKSASAATIVLLVCTGGLILMAFAVMGGGKVSFGFYHSCLLLGAVLGSCFGLWTTARIGAALTSNQTRKDFRGELISYILFWFLLPPCWFFVEYFAFDSHAIALPDGADLEKHLSKIKDYADYASKIWAALAALLGGVAAFVLGGKN